MFVGECLWVANVRPPLSSPYQLILIYQLFMERDSFSQESWVSGAAGTSRSSLLDRRDRSSFKLKLDSSSTFPQQNESSPTSPIHQFVE
jgi:hypothetical protein